MKKLGNKEKEKKYRAGVKAKIIDTLLIIISTPVILVAIIITAKTLINPDKIPDVFSYKPIIILSEGLEDGINYGDLAITKITDAKELKVGDIIAYRFGGKYITLHKINNISQTEDKLFFTVDSNISNITESVMEDNVEGLFLKKIANIRDMASNT